MNKLLDILLRRDDRLLPRFCDILRADRQPHIVDIFRRNGLSFCSHSGVIHSTPNCLFRAKFNFRVIYFQWEKSRYLCNHLWEFGITQNTVESSENRSANLKYRTNLLHHNNTEQYVLICRTYPALFRSDSVMFHDNKCVKILSCYNSVLLVNMLHFVPSDAVTFVFFLRRYQDTLLCCGSCAEVTISTSSVPRNLRQGSA